MTLIDALLLQEQDVPEKLIHHVEAIAKLKSAFRRKGFVRTQVDDRLAEMKAGGYMKGFEVRLDAADLAELRDIRNWIGAVGIDPARPYAQAKHWRQPIYGRKSVCLFLEVIGVSEQIIRRKTSVLPRKGAKRKATP